MNTRLNYQQLAPASFEALMNLEKSFKESPLDKKIIDLVKIRASQLNGCLFCLDMHSKEARTHQDRELRLYHLPVWRESDLFNTKEKAALEWAELLVQPGKHGVEDKDFENLKTHFSDKEIADLTLVIAAISAWNRLGVAFRTKPGLMDKMMGLDKIGLS